MGMKTVKGEMKCPIDNDRGLSVVCQLLADALSPSPVFPVSHDRRNGG